MSLATRCTACGTVFRVVQDQLKVSEGWVRCGRCDEVFNALEGLFDLEREAPPPGPLPAASSAQKPAPAPAPFSAGVDDSGWPLTGPAEPWEPTLADRVGAELMAVRPGEPAAAQGRPSAAQDEAVEFSNARWDAELLTDVAAQETRILAHESDAAAFDDEQLTRLEPYDAPEFVRSVERQERWRRPGMRMALGGLALLLLAGLAVQVGHHFRDTLSARWPQAQPVLAAWCAALDCSVQPPRRIDDIWVESTTLARAGGGAPAEALRLSVNLRNRGVLPLSLPSVDLKLTDGSGALIARRMLSPRDFGGAPATLPPGADTTLQLLLSTGSQPISGYTVEVFYP